VPEPEVGRQIDLLLGEAVEMEAVHAADMFAQIVAAFAAGTAQTAGARAVDRNQLSRDQTRNAWPMASTVPEASAPMTSGILRLAKAMPRQPQTSIWLSATALTETVTSPMPGGGGGGRSTVSSLRSSMSCNARMIVVLLGPARAFVTRMLFRSPHAPGPSERTMISAGAVLNAWFSPARPFRPERLMP
jgi:hypothetical protein